MVGYPNPGNNPDGPKYLPLVREQVFAGNYDSAASIWKKICKALFSKIFTTR
jgi:alpha-L-fucosidase 2